MQLVVGVGQRAPGQPLAHVLLLLTPQRGSGHGGLHALGRVVDEEALQAVVCQRLEAVHVQDGQRAALAGVRWLRVTPVLVRRRRARAAHVCMYCIYSVQNYANYTNFSYNLV